MGSFYGSEADDFRLPRKAASDVKWCPYRKLTQIGKMRILRRASESLLRNSAKLSRNLGRRDASDRGCNNQTQATVYQKHRSLLSRKTRYRD